MDGQLNFGDITVLTSMTEIILRDKDGGEVKYTPGQTSTLRDLVGALQKFGSLPAPPDRDWETL